MSRKLMGRMNVVRTTQRISLLSYSPKFVAKHSTESCMYAHHFSPVEFSVTLWTMARQAPLSMEFSTQEHRSGLRALLQGIF